MTIQKTKINQFKKIWAEANADAKSANRKALESGKILSELKQENYNGWVKFADENLKGIISRQQADKLIECYEGRYILKALGSNEPLTIGNMLNIIDKADDEIKVKAEKIKAEELAAEEQAKADRAAKAAELEAKRAEAETAKQAETKQPEIIEGDFVEIMPEPANDEDPLELLQSVIDEMQDHLQEVISDNESMVKVFESNDQLGTALSELKQAKETIRVLEERLRGLQNERNEAIRTAKMWRSKFEKLEKAAA